jgi:GNAT superfamily N-acetyltransferase
MRFRIRDFTPDDYAASAELVSAAFADYPISEKEMRFADAHRDPKCMTRRWIAERDGWMVGGAQVGQSEWMYHPQKFHLMVIVHPEHQGQGIGGALYDHLMAELAPRDPISLMSQAREDHERAVRFLKDRGFVETQRAWESRLDVAGFDFAPFEGSETRATSVGIEIRSVSELRTLPDWTRRLYDLEWELAQDVPHTETLTQPEFAQWERKHLLNPNFLPEGYFVALEGGRMVGMSQLWKSQAGSDLRVGLTGVLRKYRRRGIALALKLATIRFARERGVAELKTWNEINNRAMLSINETLGFVKQPAWIEFTNRLRDG